MDFTNHPVSPAELPTIEEVHFHPLEEEYLLAERISVVITFAVLAVIAVPFFIFIDRLRNPLIIFTALAIYLLLLVVAWVSTGISFRHSGYALRQKDLLYRSGWFIRKSRIVMLSRIQHISIQSGPIDRKFGLSSISVFTAGASQADFTIKGIREETALKIKEWVNNELSSDVREPE